VSDAEKLWFQQECRQRSQIGGTTAVSYVSIENWSIVYLCATKYVNPNGAHGLNDSNPCPTSANEGGRACVLPLGLEPLLDNASSSISKALGAPTRRRRVVGFLDNSEARWWMEDGVLSLYLIV
jgi:hypothetical protein